MYGTTEVGNGSATPYPTGRDTLRVKEAKDDQSAPKIFQEYLVAMWIILQKRKPEAESGESGRFVMSWSFTNQGLLANVTTVTEAYRCFEPPPPVINPRSCCRRVESASGWWKIRSGSLPGLESTFGPCETSASWRELIHESGDLDYHRVF